MNKINFYKSRNHYQIINVTALFFKQNFSVIFKSTLFISIPFMILGSLLYSLGFFYIYAHSINMNIDYLANASIFNYLGHSLTLILFAMLVFLIGGSTFIATIHEIINIYISDTNNAIIQVSEVQTKVFKNISKYLVTLLAVHFYLSILMISAVILLFVPVIGWVLDVFLIGYAILPVSIIFALQMSEKTDIVSAFLRCFVLMKGSIIVTVRLYFLSALIILSLIFLTSLVSGLLLGSFTLLFETKDLDAANNSFGFIFLFAFQLILSLISLIPNAFFFIACCFHFYSLREQKEAPSLHQKINDIGSMWANTTIIANN